MSAEINDIINAKPSAEGSNVVNAENSTVTNIDKPKEVKEVLAKGEKPWGYDLYPERRGTFKKQWKNIFFGSEGSEAFEKIKCEKNVVATIKRSPMVKLMMAALKSSGCPIDIRRHISCEVCDPSVTGGYDPELNQIVVCQNMCKSEGLIQGVLSHEMVHMFDFCRNELDFKNTEHLACTEIRAANLTHCSFMSSMVQADSSLTNIKQTHQECVKTKAVYSVLAVRKITQEEARAVVDKVFDKCYADLEPIGRRIRRNSRDMQKAYIEGPMYGYDYD